MATHGRLAALEDLADIVPAEGEDGEGEDYPGGSVGQGVERAEGEPHLALAGGEAVADIDRGDGLDQEADDQVGEGDVGEEEVGGALLETVVISDCAHHHQIAEYSNNSQKHLHKH